MYQKALKNQEEEQQKNNDYPVISNVNEFAPDIYIYKWYLRQTHPLIIINYSITKFLYTYIYSTYKNIYTNIIRTCNNKKDYLINVLKFNLI